MTSKEDWDDRDELQLPGSMHTMIAQLATGTATERRISREALIDIGAPTVPALAKELESSDAEVRREAAGVLSDMADPMTAPVLIGALEDPDSGVRRTAAQVLILLGRAALIPLLEALEQSADSMRIREGARHVLGALAQEGTAKDAAPVLEALQDLEAPAEVPGVAYTLLQRLYKTDPAIGGLVGATPGEYHDLRQTSL